MKKFVIIVAGGSGRRMQSNIPKQFLPLNGLPILMHTIKRFYDYDNSVNIILVLPEKHIDYWTNLCKRYNFDINHKIEQGGNTRYHSVQNGLRNISENCLVAIHDGVRPLVCIDVIRECYETAAIKKTAVPVIKINDSLRQISENNNYSVDRDKFVIVQTPQIFLSSLIISAYNKKNNKQFTDDASLVEYCGEKICLVNGNPENIKITGKADIKFAEAYLEKQNKH